MTDTTPRQLDMRPAWIITPPTDYAPVKNHPFEPFYTWWRQAEEDPKYFDYHDSTNDSAMDFVLAFAGDRYDGLDDMTENYETLEFERSGMVALFCLAFFAGRAGNLRRTQQFVDCAFENFEGDAQGFCLAMACIGAGYFNGGQYRGL